MKIFKRILCLLLSTSIALTIIACDSVDKMPTENLPVTDKQSSNISDNENEIFSSDRVMSQYFDISVFDEENYANIYLGKKFKINAKFLDEKLTVPTKLSELIAAGWDFAEGNTYNYNSLVFAYETIDVYLSNENGVPLHVQLYNSSRSSVTLSKCNIVKYIITNNYYQDYENYNSFNINGITNTMAITDVIHTLGTPSHFYKVSDTCYYLDYFITKKDRRNGITVYINPVDDSILSVEFSSYK